jgi:hypothetical protein
VVKQIMPRRKYEFAEKDKIKALLWCGRHCCLCGKFAGVRIEIAHLDETKKDMDSIIPLCFDCHAAIGHYNPQHPLGQKYKLEELKATRDQFYEHYTSHLVSPVYYKLTQAGRDLPDVGFQITHCGERYPLRAKILITLRQGAKTFGPPGGRHYDGTYYWNLNPHGHGVNGHFYLPPEAMEDRTKDTLARIDVKLYDIYDREHKLLPVGYVLASGMSDWYYEPCEEVLGPSCEN